MRTCHGQRSTQYKLSKKIDGKKQKQINTTLEYQLYAPFPRSTSIDVFVKDRILAMKIHNSRFRNVYR